MKNKYIFILLLLSVILAIFSLILLKSNYELKKSVESRQEIITKNQQIDSLNCEKTTEYKQTVEKYITKDCGLTIDGKEISLQEFVILYNKQQDERIKELQESIDNKRELIKVRDSLSNLKLMSKNLGIKVNTKKSNDTTYVSYESAKIDSAMVLLQYFRKKMRYDEKEKKWIISVK